MYLTNGQITLRPVTLNDAYELFNLIDASRQNLRRYLPWVDDIYQPEDEQTSLAKSLPKQTILMLAIEIDQTIVGLIDLHDISKDHHKAQIGYFLGDAYVGLGYMNQALNLLQKYAFEEMNLHRLEILIDMTNHKSQAVAQRLGYQKEATLRDYLYYNKQFRTFYLYALLKSEWQMKNKFKGEKNEI